MILTTEEISWVKDRLNWYDIPYQEIYDEIVDHVLSGIEEQRLQGNEQDVKLVYQQVVDEHFGGFMGIEKIAREQETAYKKMTIRLTWQIVKRMFTLPACLFIMALGIVGFYLPQTKVVAVILFGGLVLMSLSLWFYAQWQASFNKVQKGKRSLASMFINRQGHLPLVIINAMINIPNLYNFIVNGLDYQYKLVALHPAIMTLSFGTTLIYCLACVGSGKHHLKGEQTA